MPARAALGSLPPLRHWVRDRQIVIIFVLTREHSYTVDSLVSDPKDLLIRSMTYDELFGRKQLPRATYIFTDLDRLPNWRVRQAARFYRILRDAGARVLNDPAQMPSRYGLLRKLHRHGLNDFNAYRIEEAAQPTRWPVFLRAEGDHDAPLTDLIYNWDDARRAIDHAIDTGVPATSLLLVEYAAEPVRPGLFRKLSVFRIGETYVGANCVHEDKWLVKYGTVGIAPPELYDDDLRIVRDNPFEAPLKSAFELASIEYGRADFGFVGGKAQVYEINSNPSINFPTEHPSAARLESYAIFTKNLYGALAKIDMPT